MDIDTSCVERMNHVYFFEDRMEMQGYYDTTTVIHFTHIEQLYLPTNEDTIMFVLQLKELTLPLTYHGQRGIVHKLCWLDE